MRTAILLVLGTVALVGCDQSMPSPNASPPPATPKDNTAINARDQAPEMKTPIDQAQNQADVTLTAEIRKQIVAQPDFSVNAQNVKVIASQGHVTLRGPVASQQEVDAILKIAQQQAGADKVDNQLEIAP